MNIHEYIQCAKDGFKWQWRWGVLKQDLADKREIVGQCLEWFALGVTGLTFLIVTPLAIPLALVWQFVIYPLILPFKLTPELAQKLHERVNQCPTDSQAQ